MDIALSNTSEKNLKQNSSYLLEQGESSELQGQQLLSMLNETLNVVVRFLDQPLGKLLNTRQRIRVVCARATQKMSRAFSLLRLNTR